MKLKKITGLGVLAAVMVAVALVTPGVAAAQEPAQQPTGDGILSEYQDEIHTALADALGLTLAEFEAKIDSGMTLSQIAYEQGVSWTSISAVMATARADVIAELAAEGLITPSQAGWFTSRSTGMMGSGRGSGAYAYGDADGDGICDYTGQPVLQSLGVSGGRSAGRTGGRMGGGRWGGGR